MTSACRHTWWWHGVLALVAAGIGCGHGGLEGTIPIRGKVLYNGQPVRGGEVRYMPTDVGQGRVARGPLDDQGEFELTSLKRGDGALPGDYRVVVLSAAPAAANDNLADGADHLASVGNSKMQYERPAKPKQRATTADGPASQVPLRYTRPQESGLTDHVSDQHPGYKLFELTD